MPIELPFQFLPKTNFSALPDSKELDIGSLNLTFGD